MRKPLDEWIHVQQDVYPAYITWEQYLTHQERLRRNLAITSSDTPGAQGATRTGAALLQGIVVCGECGHRMSVKYKPTSRYICEALARQLGVPACASFLAATIDAAVVQAFFEVLQPSQLDVLEAIVADQQVERDRLVRQWEERLKRAQYDVHLAQRQYDAVDPDNRLVAAELERRWEMTLQHLQETQAAYAHFQHTMPSLHLTPEQRDQFRHISDTLPALWNRGRLDNDQKKDLLRSLIAQVVLQRQAPDRVEAKIVWISGHYSIITVQTSTNRNCDVTGYDAMVTRLQELWQAGLDDAQIAAQLTAEGFHSARTSCVSVYTVRQLRARYGWYRSVASSRRGVDIDGQLTVSGLADRLGVTKHWIYYWIHNECIDPKYITRHPVYKVLLIQDDPELNEFLRQQVALTACDNGGI